MHKEIINNTGLFDRLLGGLDDVLKHVGLVQQDSHGASEAFKELCWIRSQHKFTATASLADKAILEFLSFDKNLREAVFLAAKRFPQIQAQDSSLTGLSEGELVTKLQEGILNFYSTDSVSPYVPLAAKGPWIVTFHGGVIFDSGGYGMLGFGYNPDFLQAAISTDLTMANVMTASFSQKKMLNALRKNIGINRECPYARFIFMNSGSESNCVAARISDAHTKAITAAGARHSGKKVKFLGLQGGFHGRTYRAAQLSNSSYPNYSKYLASFAENELLITVEPNNPEALKAAFAEAEKNNTYFEAMFIEPVMGEGRAGFAVSPEFYHLARKLCSENETLLIVDSIQAGLRTNGVLSIVDYPGFEKLEAPDMETFSKAINAGQFPLSVLALSAKAAEMYKPGLYGNTMTGNPRGLEIGSAILNHMSSDITGNIRSVGAYFLEKVQDLKKANPDIIKEVMGQGLLVSVQLAESHPIEGIGGVENKLRLKGINVIHASGNRLRFTPWFNLSRTECDLIIQKLSEVIADFR